MTRPARGVTWLLAGALLLGACSAPLPGTSSAPAGTDAAPAAPAQAQAAVAQTGTRSTAPLAAALPATPSAFVPAPTRTPGLAADAAPPTPFAPSVTPLGTAVPPALPTLTVPARAPLDPSSQAAATAYAATAIAAGNSATATAAALPPQVIVMQDLAFSPATVTVRPGTTVIWQNMDQVQHQVQGGEFDSNWIKPGEQWASVMNRPGRFGFICALHPTMRAEVIVSPDNTRPLQVSS